MNTMDLLKEFAIQLGVKIKPNNHLNINFKEKSYRQLVVKDYKGYKLKVYEFGELFLISIYVQSDFAFSINNPDAIFFFNHPLLIKGLPYKIYISDSEKEDAFFDENTYIFWKFFICTFLLDKKLKKNETVFIYKNCIAFALNSKRNLLSILDDTINLISNHVKIFKKIRRSKISLKDIPNNLRLLLPLMKKWSLSDDTDREQLIEGMGEKQKKKLISTVYPLMNDINKFLDSFKDNLLSEEAILLGNLAELVSELKIRSEH